MPYVMGVDRREALLLPECLDDFIAQEHEVRVLDAFVEQLDWAKLGFVHPQPAATGRPPYAPGDLLKLWLWGYLNRVTSSRKLERECGRNLELLWLLRRLQPDHWTINDFRRQAGAALKGVLRDFTLFCQELELIGGRLVVIDGTKLKASNHPTRQYSAAQVAQKIASLEAVIEGYLQECDTENAQSVQPSPMQSAASVEKLQAELGAARQLQARLEESGLPKVPVTDPQCRPLRKVGLGYNAQIAVDATHHLIVAADIVDASNDQQQLVPMAGQARAGLGQSAHAPLQVVADKGYYDRVSLAAAEAANLEVYVPKPRKGHGQEEGRFHKSQFIYEAVADVYRCPGGALLPRETQTRKRDLLVYLYAQPAACRDCALRAQCTTSKYRRIERWEHEAVLERAAQRLAAAPQMMRIRRSVVEHPFGTMKFWNHQWALLTRGRHGARTELTLSVLAYNLKRLFTLRPLGDLLAALKVRWQRLGRFLEALWRLAALLTPLLNSAPARNAS